MEYNNLLATVDDLRNIADINGFKRVLVIKQGQVYPTLVFMTDEFLKQKQVQ